MQAASERMEFEQAAAIRDLISTVEEMQERQRVAAAEGRDVDIYGVLCRAAAGRRESVSRAQRPRSRPPRIFLGGSRSFRAVGISRVADQADLHRPRIRAVSDPRADRVRGSGFARRIFERQARTQSGDFDSAARLKESDARSGRAKRTACFPAALSRQEAIVEAGHGLPGRCAQPAGIARPHRMLRHLPHSGHRHGGLDGGVGRKAG